MTGIQSISSAKYAADPCDRPSLSSGIANLICSSSPLHARMAHPKLNPEYVSEEAEHFDIGTVAHALILEGYSVAEVLKFPDWRTNAAREARDAARKAGKVPILEKNWANVLGMVASARTQLETHKDAKDAFTDGLPERTIVWEEDGVVCRARPDWLKKDYKRCFDYKTSSATANPEVISRTLWSNGWPIQAAFYLRGIKAVTGVEAEFLFVCQETFAPYALSVIALGPDSMAIAEKQVLFAIDKWRECLGTNVWPGYPDRICYASLPPWIESAWIAKELE